MKNQYVGDINDFAKYGLLKCLAGCGTVDGSRLGVIWYLTPDGLNRDGGRLGYLGLPKPNHYTAADALLFDQLALLVASGERNVRRVESLNVLPADTVFYSDVLAAPDRNDWFTAALEATADCDLIFLDPDNGMVEGNGVRPKPRYATTGEVLDVFNRDQSVVVIQFLNRLSGHVQQLERWLGRLRYALADVTAAPFALHWHGPGAYGSLGFFIVPARRHAEVLTDRARQMVAGPWGRYFDLRLPSSR